VLKKKKSDGVRATFRRLWPYLRKYRRRALGVIFLGAIAALGSKANLALLKPLVNLLFPEQAAGESQALSQLDEFDLWLTQVLEGASVLGLSPIGSKVVLIGGGIFVSALLFSFVQFTFLRVSRMLGVRMIADLRQDLTEHVLSLDLAFHSRRRLGDLLSRMTQDVSDSLRIMLLVVEEIIQEPFNIFAGLLMAYFASPTATIGLLIFLPILAMPVIKFGPKVRRRSAASQARLGDTTQALTQMFSGIREVKVFRMEQREADEFRDANTAFVAQTDKMVRTQALSQGITNFFAYGGIGLVVGLIALVNTWVPLFSDAGSMMAFFAAIGVTSASTKRLSKAISTVYTSMGATQRVFEVLDIRPEIQEPQHPKPITGVQNSIHFRGVSFSYEDSSDLVLKNVDFEVPQGSSIALVGESGSGKSTLLDLLARFYDPTKGSIEVDGTPLPELGTSGWRDHLAVVGQRPFLFQTTLRENVRYGRPEATDQEVEEACESAGLGPFVDSLPDGLDTPVGEAGTRLSGGQAQRVTIARALLKDAAVLLLDEATSALDSASERRVQVALDGLMEGRTTFVIAHRLSTIRDADRILVLREGVIIEDGDHAALLASNGHYARLWRMQAEGEQLS